MGKKMGPPTKVDALPPLKSVAMADQTMCVLTETGDVYYGPDGTHLKAVPGIANAIQVVALAYGCCAVLDDGGVKCWGSGESLGNGMPAMLEPQLVVLP